MESEPRTPSSALAARIVSNASLEIRALLLTWGTALLAIRESDACNEEKIKCAFIATRDAQPLWPIIKDLVGEAKRCGWEMRGWAGRLGLSTASASMLLFGSQCAGIAALGGAISVPLWVVFGAGSGFMATLIDEIKSRE
jgi:hypothetical protein